MRKVVHQVYTFSELSKEVQERVLERYYDINTDYDWWEYEEHILPESTGISTGKIDSFDVRYPYRHFAFDDREMKILYPKKFISHYNLTKALYDKIDVTFESLRESTTKMIIYPADGVTLTKAEQNLCDYAENVFRNEMLGILLNIEKSYEYLTSEEAIKETLEANKYEFYKDGRTYIPS